MVDDVSLNKRSNAATFSSPDDPNVLTQQVPQNSTWYVESIIVSQAPTDSVFGGILSDSIQKAPIEQWRFDERGFEEGFAYSSSNNLVYVGGSSSSKVFAVNTDTGSVDWSSNMNSDAATDILYLEDDENVYAGTSSDRIYKFDAKSGFERQNFTVSDSFDAIKAIEYNPDENYIHFTQNDTLFATSEGFNSRWQTTLPADIDSGIVYDTNNKAVYCGTNSSTVHSIDAVDGSENWQFNANDRVQSEIVYNPDDDLVYFGDRDYVFFAVDANTGSKVWESSTAESFVDVAEVITYNSKDSLVYIGTSSSKVVALDATTGTKEWVFDEETNEQISAQLAYVENKDRLFVASESGAVIALNSLTGDKIFSSKLPSQILGGVTYNPDDGIIYFGGDQDFLVALNDSQITSNKDIPRSNSTSNPSAPVELPIDEYAYSGETVYGGFIGSGDASVMLNVREIVESQ